MKLKRYTEGQDGGVDGGVAGVGESELAVPQGMTFWKYRWRDEVVGEGGDMLLQSYKAESKR